MPLSNPNNEYQNFLLLNLDSEDFQKRVFQKAPVVKSPGYHLIVVLDCSGSMSGSRIRLAREILKELLESPQVDVMTVIKFGTHVQNALYFTKKNSADILNINADCGGTNFEPAIKKLMEEIKNVSSGKKGILGKISSLLGWSSKTKEGSKLKLTALFFSDGEAGNPESLYQPLKKCLIQYNCPLMSVAVTTNAQPELMIRLSQLFGNLDLVLLRQNDEMQNGLRLIEEKLCLGLEICQTQLHLEYKGHSYQHKFSFREQQEKCFMFFKTKHPLNETDINFELKIEGKGDLKIGGLVSAINFEGSTDVRLSNLSQILKHLIKIFISKMAQNSLQKDEALQMLGKLRQIVLSNSVQENYFKEIEALRKDKSNPKHLQEILKKQKELKTNTLELQTSINQLEDLINGGDLRAALETYSAKTVSNKVNRRAMRLAQFNAEKNLPSSLKDWVVQNIMKSAPDSPSSESPECILWCINQLDTAVQTWLESPSAEFDVTSLDWVGRGCLVYPGKTAALNAWGLASVQIRPVNISNGSISYVKISENDNGRRLAEIKGMNIGEFNCSVPFVHPAEDIRVHRLAMAFIKGTQEGTRAFSNLFCGSPNLFAIEQVFAFYSVASVCSLMKADKTVNFEDSARAILSLWDLAFYSQKDKDVQNRGVLEGGNASDLYVKENIERLVADPLDFIARKDDTNMTGFLRLWYLLMVGDAHLQELLKDKSLGQFLKEIKYALLMRQLLDLTSSRFTIEGFMGFNKNKYKKEVYDSLEANTEKSQLVGEFRPKVDLKFLRLSKMAKGLGLLEVLEGFRQSQKCENFRELHCRILKSEIAFDLFVEELKKTKTEEKKGPLETVAEFLEFDESLLTTLKPEQNPRLKVEFDLTFEHVLERMVMVCTHKHSSGASIPKHDSSYNSKTLKEFSKVEDLFTGSFNVIFLKAMKSIENHAIDELGDAQKKLRKIKTLIQKIKGFQKTCPLERLYIPFRENELSFSGDHIPKFTSKQRMFNYLGYEHYGEELMQALESLDLGNVADFDLKAERMKKSRYLHGFSLFLQTNLSKSTSAEQLYNLMEKDLESHYEEKNQNEDNKYVFGAIKKKWLRSKCEHVYRDSLIYEELNAMDISDEEEAFKRVLSKFPDCLTTQGYDENIRKEHVAWLISARLKKEFPFH